MLLASKGRNRGGLDTARHLGGDSEGDRERA